MLQNFCKGRAGARPGVEDQGYGVVDKESGGSFLLRVRLRVCVISGVSDLGGERDASATDSACAALCEALPIGGGGCI